jgi:uncharacterized SAM-binding protein YcdF (DUF218 family)
MKKRLLFLFYAGFCGLIASIVLSGGNSLPASESCGILNYAKGPGISAAVIYVLGGSQTKLEKRFEKAASLYHRSLRPKVLILSRPGNTEYSPRLGRNLTNDEWSIGKLVSYGVNFNDIEPVAIGESAWGTYSEAEVISQLIVQRGYRNLILVSSSHHAERVCNSFRTFLDKDTTKLGIYPSNETIGWKDYVLEYLKLGAYKTVLYAQASPVLMGVIQPSDIILKAPHLCGRWLHEEDKGNASPIADDSCGC